jgi:hypothetical protein
MMFFLRAEGITSYPPCLSLGTPPKKENLAFSLKLIGDLPFTMASGWDLGQIF